MLPYPPLILRPAMIGLALAMIIVAFLVLMPRRAGEEGMGNLPPRLFPIFDDREVEEEPILPPILVEIYKTPTRQEVIQGGTVSFEITIRNIGDHILRSLTLDERFDDRMLKVVDAGGGSISQNRLAWFIAMLQPSEEHTIRYSMQVQKDAAAAPFQTTAYVYGEDIQEMTSGLRMVSTDIAIIALPQSGVEQGIVMNWISEILH